MIVNLVPSFFKKLQTKNLWLFYFLFDLTKLYLNNKMKIGNAIFKIVKN